MNDRRVDIIIPTYGPGEKFLRLLEGLGKQTVMPEKIIVINTERNLWDVVRTQIAQTPGLAWLREAGTEEAALNGNPGQYGNGENIGNREECADAETAESRKNCDNGDGGDTEYFGVLEVHHIKKEAFDHAYARNLGVSFSQADIFICMTQDAVPQDIMLIERLTAPIAAAAGTDGVKMSYARQLCYEGDPESERISRQFNYPDTSSVKSIADLDRLGIKTFFASNVCAAYDRETFDMLGGFAGPAIFNEDMVYACGLVKAGFSIAYCADARVYHSHRYSMTAQLKRNFDNAASQKLHPEVFEGISSESEGIRLVRAGGGQLVKRGRITELPGFICTCGFKYMGFLLGRKCLKMPINIVKKLSASPDFWERRAGKESAHE